MRVRTDDEEGEDLSNFDEPVVPEPTMEVDPLMQSMLETAEAMRVLAVRRLYSHQVSFGLVPFLKMEPEMSEWFITEQARKDPVALAALIQDLCSTLSSITCADVDFDVLDTSQLRSYPCQVVDLFMQAPKSEWGNAHMFHRSTPMCALSLDVASADANMDLQYLRLAYVVIYISVKDYPNYPVRTSKYPPGELYDYFEDLQGGDYEFVLKERNRIYLEICTAETERNNFRAALFEQCVEYESQWCKLKLTEQMYLTEFHNFKIIIYNFPSCTLALVLRATLALANVGVFKKLDTSNFLHVEFVANGIMEKVQNIARDIRYVVNMDELFTVRVLLPYVMSGLVQDESFVGSN
jgi:hypothetical protein